MPTDGDSFQVQEFVYDFFRAHYCSNKNFYSATNTAAGLLSIFLSCGPLLFWVFFLFFFTFLPRMGRKKLALS